MNNSKQPVAGGTHVSTGMQIDTGWHYHDMHQLLYAFEGSVEIEDEDARYLVPHQFAAWIPEGTRHRTRIQRVSSGSVFLNSDLLQSSETNVSIVRAPPLMREMVKEGMRWPIMESIFDPIADSFFQTFALLCSDWILEKSTLVLPTTTDQRLGKAMEYTQNKMACITFRDVCSYIGLSERALRRRFVSELGMNWEDYRLSCRMFTALELLEQEHIPIIDIAAAVGYSSPSAFSKAFRSIMHEAPSDYRRRRFGVLQ